MTQFLFTAKDREGNSITERIEAESIHGARYKLETRGMTDITFHTDESTAVFDRLNEMGDLTPPQVLTPKQELEARRLGGFFSQTLFALKGSAALWVPLLCWNALSFYQGRPYRWGDWTGFILSGLFWLQFIWLGIPGLIYNLMLEAGVWHRWNEVRRWTRILRWYRRITGMGVPAFELDFRLAYGVAATQGFEPALDLVRHHENSAVSKPMYLGRLAELHAAAGDYQGMNACRVKAVELSNGGIAETIDLALGLIRRLRQPTAARAALDRLEDQEVGEIVRIFLAYCRGLIALEEGEFAAAERSLRETLELSQPYLSNPIVRGMNLEIKAFLSLALAGQGRFQEALPLYHETKAMMQARQEIELMNRCQGALGIVQA